MKYNKIILVSLFFIGTSLSSFSQFSTLNCQIEPVYKENGGHKKTNIFNKKKVARETAIILLCDLFKKLEDLLKGNVSNDYANKVKDALYLEKEKTILESFSKLVSIEKKLEGNNVTSTNDYEQVLEILKELNELSCKEVVPIAKLLNKRVNRIYGDISFKTGSADISLNGISEISSIINEMISDIAEWKSYIGICNERTFENDLFIVVVDIDGYADSQGSSTTNLVLSQKRADAVKLELIRQLNELVVSGKVNVIFDKIQSRGFGESLPFGIKEVGPNDPKRRICLINSLVGPAKLLKPKM